MKKSINAFLIGMAAMMMGDVFSSEIVYNFNVIAYPSNPDYEEEYVEFNAPLIIDTKDFKKTSPTSGYTPRQSRFVNLRTAKQNIVQFFSPITRISTTVSSTITSNLEYWYVTISSKKLEGLKQFIVDSEDIPFQIESLEFYNYPSGAEVLRLKEEKPHRRDRRVAYMTDKHGEQALGQIRAIATDENGDTWEMEIDLRYDKKVFNEDEDVILEEVTEDTLDSEEAIEE